MDKYEIYSKAIEKYGADSQIDMAIEEMAELTQALFKVRRYQKAHEGDYTTKLLDHVSEEMADVINTLEQVKMIYQNEDLIDWHANNKLKRLEERLRENEN